MVVFLIYVLPMVLPTVIYGLWRLWRARRTVAVIDSADVTSVNTPEAINWREAPWLLLVLAGAALLVLVLLTGVFTEGAKDEGRYLPPRMENGRIVPGEMRPDPPPTAPRPNDASGPP